MDRRAHIAAQGDAATDIELECRTWDWARTAGVSAEELRAALLETMRDARQTLAQAA